MHASPEAPPPWRTGDRFTNLDGSIIPPKDGFARVLKWKLSRRPPPVLAGALNRPATPVTPSATALAEPAHPLQVVWLGHATILIQADGANLITDPVFGNCGMGFVKRLCPAPLAVDALPAIDGVLISHNHFDHCDLPSIRALRRRNPGVTIYVPQGLGGWMSRKLGGPVVELGWWQQAAVGAATVHAVPAHHWSTRGAPGDIRRSHWCGFVVQGSGGSVFFAGDTGYGAHFQAIAERLDIDLALLPVGAYAPRWFMRDQHMNPEDAVAAARTLGAALLPIHWGTFRLTDEPLDEPPRWTRLLAEEAGVPLHLVHPGGRWTPTSTEGQWRWPGAAS